MSSNQGQDKKLNHAFPNSSRFKFIVRTAKKNFFGASTNESYRKKSRIKEEQKAQLKIPDEFYYF